MTPNLNANIKRIERFFGITEQYYCNFQNGIYMDKKGRQRLAGPHYIFEFNIVFDFLNIRPVRMDCQKTHDLKILEIEISDGLNEENMFEVPARKELKQYIRDSRKFECYENEKPRYTVNARHMCTICEILQGKIKCCVIPEKHAVIFQGKYGSYLLLEVLKQREVNT